MLAAAETLTLVFTDIEGSTRLLAAAEDEYPAILESHRAIIRSRVEAHGGEIDSTDGDACLAVFDDAATALLAAEEAQRALLGEHWPGAGRVRVRIGVHTGMARRAATGVVGFEVHRAARIAAAAHGGQVVVSEQAIRHGVAHGVELIDLGLHRFKDIDEPTRIYQMASPGLPVDFPRLNSLSGQIYHLPSMPTELIGRDDEVTRVRALLQTERLVTVLGPGGVGKTSLATHVAAEALDQFPDGIWYVDLTRVREDHLVADVVVEALGIEASPNPTQAIVDACRQRRMLVVVDNVEHVIEASTMFGEMVSGTRYLTVLATSRERLRLPAERVFVLEPLTDAGPELFVDRARMAEPAIRFTDAEMDDVAAVCQALDGLPLAIVLAAANARVLSPSAIRARLAGGIGSLPGATRGGPPRHRTIAATIQWSFELLDDRERRLFVRMAVFPTARPLEAIDDVCGFDMVGGTLPALSALIDKSLVTRRAGGSGEPRFAMLELVQEFAHHRFIATDEGPLVRRRHAVWAAALAERLDDELWGPDVDRAFTSLHDQHANLRAAVTWAFEHDAVLAGRITGGLAYFWFREQRDVHTMGCVERALGIGGLPDTTMARLLNGRAYHLFADGEVDAACAAWARASDHAVVAGHDRLRSLSRIGTFARIGDPRADQNVIAECEKAVREARSRGHRLVEAQGLNILGELYRLRGDDTRSERAYLQALEIADMDGDLRRQSMLYMSLSFIAYHRGDGEHALAMARKAFVLQERMRGVATPHQLQALTGPLILTGQPIRAALLFGAGLAEFERIGQMPFPGDKPEFEQVRRRLDGELGEDGAARAIAEGRTLSRADVTRLALDLDSVH